MFINKILGRTRRDLHIELKCRECGHTYETWGYDDARYHNDVVPGMKCPECGKKAGADYVPIEPLYPANAVV